MTTKKTYAVALPDISILGALFANQTRAAILGALMSGTAWTARELAIFAHTSKANATEQINKLVNGGLIAEHRQGRHRYLKIASPQVAHLIETLAQSTEAQLPTPRSLNAARAKEDFYHGRTCYHHLAGELGVELLSELLKNRYLNDDVQLTEKGTALLKSWGMKHPEKLKGKPCLDTTHRKFHLAGTLGTGICEHFIKMAWLIRDKKNRCVHLSLLGQQLLAQSHIHLKTKSAASVQ